MAQAGPLKKKLKVWVWNSWQTFQLVPNMLFKAISLAIVGSFIVAALLVMGISCGSVYLLGKGFSKLSGIEGIGEVASIILFFLEAIVLVPTAAILFAASAVVNIAASLAVQLTFGLAGIAFGITTTPLLLLKDPHRFWIKQKEDRLKFEKENMKRQRQGLRPALLSANNHNQGITSIMMRGASSSIPIIRRLEKAFSPDDFILNAVREFDDEDFLKFRDFNPNSTKCQITGRDLFNSDDKQNIQVVKIRDGQYALKSELDKKREDYDDSDIVIPQLQRKFERDTIDCAICLEVLPAKDEAKHDKPVVRTVYGDYFDKESLAEWLGNKRECPATRRYLDMTLVSDVDVPPPPPAPDNAKEPTSAPHPVPGLGLLLRPDSH